MTITQTKQERRATYMLFLDHEKQDITIQRMNFTKMVKAFNDTCSIGSNGFHLPSGTEVAVEYFLRDSPKRKKTLIMGMWGNGVYDGQSLKGLLKEEAEGLATLIKRDWDKYAFC